MPNLNFLKQTLSRLAHYANSTVPEAQETPWYHLWSIGIYKGPSPVSMAPAPGIKNPVLTRDDVTDVVALFVADPFMIKVGDTWYMFFEVYNRKTHAEIGVATSRDGFHWQYQQIVLSEPYHLSYPYVFEWNGDHYMIPESSATREIRLYRARRFPDQWEHVTTLMEGRAFADSSIVHHNDRWWLFTESSQGRFDTLRLFSAKDLMGPWERHPCSPIIEWNPNDARPAGRILTLPGCLIRFAQGCSPNYGTDVHAFEITDLTPTSYRERPIAQSSIVGPTGRGWNAGGMHHVDAHQLDDAQWMACVDGWTPVASLLDNLKRPA